MRWLRLPMLGFGTYLVADTWVRGGRSPGHQPGPGTRAGPPQRPL